MALRNFFKLIRVVNAMANKRVRDVLFQLLFMFVFVNAYHAKSRFKPNDLITRLLGSSNTNKPVILVLDVAKQTKTSESDDIIDVGDEEVATDRDYEYHDRDYIERSNDGNIHVLYQLLRNSNQDSSSSDESSDATKEVLRSALRSRCRKVESCVQQCPPRKPSCPKKCQQKLDDLQLCPPPETDPCENKSRCQKGGKTMPPYWRFK